MIRFRPLLLLLVLWALPLAAEEVLDTPAGLRVEVPPAPRGRTTVILRWEPVPGAVGYEVLQMRGGQWWLNEDDPNCIPITTSATLGGLEPGRTYLFRVRAVGPHSSVSQPSEPVEARTLDPEMVSRPGPAPVATSTATRRIDPEAPPPPPPTGLFAIFQDSETIRLAWRSVPEAASYKVEEEKDGKWVALPGEEGYPKSPTTLLPDHPLPGPYKFRVRSVGANGKVSEPTLPVTVER
ncbi:MAG TPA: fibronectin type III domain-containing protein [Candidatus Nitrosotenuis sp.]|nr:fibronectin type III domain-containing protein [Candidatus Nitrosotenuis sp.]